MGKRAAGPAMVVVLGVVLAGCGEVGRDALPRLPVGSGASAPATVEAGADPSAATARDLSFPVSRIEYRLRGALPELAGPAPAYRLSAEAGRDRVARLARALGLAGEVESVEGGGWQVAGGERLLRVDPYGGLPWSFGDGSGAISSGCAVAEPGYSGEGGPEQPEPEIAPVPPAEVVPPGRPVEIAPVPPADGVAPGPVECAPPPPLPDLPSGAEAERIARALFDEAGIDLDGARAEVAEDQHRGRWVSLEPVAGGIPVIGMDHTATLGSGGAITSASGFLARPEELGDYPLVGAAKGFERLTDGMEAVGGTPRPLAGAEPAAAPDPGRPADPAPDPGRPADPAPDCSSPTVVCDPPPIDGGPPVPAPQPLVIEVTGAEIVLVLVTGGCAGEPAHLVPSYRFALADGGFAGPVPAAEESRLDRPDQSQSSGDPCPGTGASDLDEPVASLPGSEPGASGGGSPGPSGSPGAGASTPP